jgi:alpha-glucuronidase
MLNHWDNLDGTVERGYAGASIWDWQRLPGFLDPRYRDYARANASLGINGTVVTNVNANALVLSESYIRKAAALANVFRSYGIKLYLTARFSAPIELGGLQTADPLDPAVMAWWKAKADEIYKYIPDFGGFVVKANSEGQPGPQNYGRSHLDGANTLADALAPHCGLLIWRAFVYSDTDPTDRAKQAYEEFVPYDGKFRDNVVIQVKNGPIDFQPREPIHPLFGALKKTPLLVEFQITKEYLGFATHLAFLPSLFEEVLQTDSGYSSKDGRVSRVADGSLYDTALGGLAGVANIGSDLNWTGHPFGQADWYGFGRLAWDPDLPAAQLAEEWIRATLGNDIEMVKTVKSMMLNSREAVVNYMMPLGLHHLFDTGHHYGPGPWVSNLSRPEWNPTYYHQADESGIGFDRTATGSNALSQYTPKFASRFLNPDTCPEEYLLWFHHLPWNYRLKNGQNLWHNMGLKYQKGVDTVRDLIRAWGKVQDKVNTTLHIQVAQLLQIQLQEAIWWKDACMSYFQTFSNREFPEGMEAPEHPLEYYKSLKFPYAPGTRPSWN